MEIRNRPLKIVYTTFSSVLYGKILVSFIFAFRITSVLLTTSWLIILIFLANALEKVKILV